MKKIFIDGKAGTTGLRIEERLAARRDVEIISLPDALRKDTEARRQALNSADVVFLCLPDDAAREAVSMIENATTAVIDTSTAHRTNPNFAYGFPELGEEFAEKIRKSNRIAVPGCHACGFIALIHPLVKAGILAPDTPLTVHSLTGYSGGGKKMIAEYEADDVSPYLLAPRQYGIAQAHKHIPEMMKISGVEKAPIFCPIVSSFYSGMEVTVPLFADSLKYGTASDIAEIYRATYNTPIVKFRGANDESGFLSAARYSGLDTMSVELYGSDERILLVARYDNLGKGASGAAVECLNMKLGCELTEGLEI